jgi:alpha-L-fucosidase 2
MRLVCASDDVMQVEPRFWRARLKISPSHRYSVAILVILLLASASRVIQPQSAQNSASDKDFRVDAARLLSRSSIYLERPNLLPGEAMPLGNGRLGAAVWSQDGLTVQLNRGDTLPRRLSPGQLHIAGLKSLTTARDYAGVLDLYNGEFVEHGHGMTVKVYVQPHSDLLIVDVTGADPHRPQTAQLALWSPRKPVASVNGKQGWLAEAWTDEVAPGASGRRFGSLAALAIEGSAVSIKRDSNLSITASFFPDAHGHFRVFVASPHYNGEQSPAHALARTFADKGENAHKLWWHQFWQRVGLIEVNSSDGWGEYMEDLRNIYLFSGRADSGGEYPGSQAGIADLFSSVKDTHQWDPAAFWHWNLRMQVAANIGAGIYEANRPYFNLYRENLHSMTLWTQQHMQGRPGVCVPETMRFNGQGYENPVVTGQSKPVIGMTCDAASAPYYNARTISTGAEVSHWIWLQFLHTRDRAFLATNYPVMEAASRFLLAYEKPGPDGLEHTSPSNAHETQWDTTDPTTDLAARHVLFADTMRAAQLLGQDQPLVSRLRAAIDLVPSFPRTQEAGPLSLLTTSSDAQANDVIASSYNPDAPQHNVQNIGLEPVWPYGLIGADSPLEALAQRTFAHRPYPTNQDWSFDPIQAARLGLGEEVSKTLIKITQTYQRYPNGMASWGGTSGEFYMEQDAVVATALAEVLVQDFDGTIRIARGLPPGWNMEGTVFLAGRTTVHVKVVDGVVRTLVLDAGMSTKLRLQSPWPDAQITVLEAGSPARTLSVGPSQVAEIAVRAGTHYLIRRTGHEAVEQDDVPHPQQVGHARRIGQNTIGLQANKAVE